MADKKYYWLKLGKDFFDRHEIKVIEDMPNGKEYVLFYIKLMCESINHDGDLRFSERIAYTPEMLASVTRTDVQIATDALDLFLELGLVEREVDDTLIMTKVADMTGNTSAEDNAERQRRYRERQKEAKKQECNANVTERNENVTEECNANVTEPVTKHNESIEYRDKSIELRDNNNMSKNETFSDEFEVLWDRYPRKDGKKKALVHYKAARRDGVTFETISQGLNKYLEYIRLEKIQTRYIKIGSTWFCGRCWDDEYKTGTETEETFEERLNRI